MHLQEQDVKQPSKTLQQWVFINFWIFHCLKNTNGVYHLINIFFKSAIMLFLDLFWFDRTAKDRKAIAYIQFEESLWIMNSYVNLTE